MLGIGPCVWVIGLSVRVAVEGVPAERIFAVQCGHQMHQSIIRFSKVESRHNESLHRTGSAPVGEFGVGRLEPVIKFDHESFTVLVVKVVAIFSSSLLVVQVHVFAVSDIECIQMFAVSFDRAAWSPNQRGRANSRIAGRRESVLNGGRRSHSRLSLTLALGSFRRYAPIL